MSTRCRFAGVLFDLDGTLLDTAPDLLAALDAALQQHGFRPGDLQPIKPFIVHHKVKTTGFSRLALAFPSFRKAKICSNV